MNIGIIGLGIIGNANKCGFESIGHNVIVHDTKLQTKITDVVNCEIVFVCVPTPTGDNEECDTRIVESVVKELFLYNYKGIIAIRSTVPPGFTDTISKRFERLRICFVPEFLHERTAKLDFIENHNLLVVGTDDLTVYRTVVDAHKNLPKKIQHLKPVEAEILKYYNNVYAALRVVFANIMFELCNKFGANYEEILNTYLYTNKTTGKYLKVNDELRGFGGACLPKDTKALIQILQENNLDFDLIESIKKDNQKFKTTVFDNMRL